MAETHPGLEPGLSFTVEHVVKEENLASSFGNPGVEVLATPYIIAWMEEAARELALRYIPKDQSTVGIAVSIRHRAAASLGANVRATVTLRVVKERHLFFDVVAESEKGTIAEGSLERYIVPRERFVAEARSQGS